MSAIKVQTFQQQSGTINNVASEYNIEWYKRIIGL